MEQHGAWGSRSRDGLHDKTPEKHEFDMNVVSKKRRKILEQGPPTMAQRENGHLWFSLPKTDYKGMTDVRDGEIANSWRDFPSIKIDQAGNMICGVDRRNWTTSVSWFHSTDKGFLFGWAKLVREKKQLQQGVPCFVLDPSDSKAADIDDVSLIISGQYGCCGLQT